MKSLYEETFRTSDPPVGFIDNLPFGVLITDDCGMIRYINAAAEYLTGLSAYDMEGKPFEEDIDGVSFRKIPCGREDLRNSSRSCIGDMEIARTDGRVVPVAHISFPIKDGFDDLIGTAHILEDVTDRKRLEEDLKRSEDNYLRLFEHSKDMIFIHSKGGIFRDVNQACVEMLGYDSKEELLSVASMERVYVNPIHRKVFQEQIDRYGYVKDFETSYKKKDGTRIHCLVSGTAVRDKDGRIVGYEAISKDITARMDGFRNLHQQHRELSLLYSVAVSMNITHELQEILQIALRKVLEILNLEAGAVFLINRERSDFVLKVQQGLSEHLQGGQYRISLYDQALMGSLLSADHSLKPQCTFPPFKATLLGINGTETLQLLCFLITGKERAEGFIALEVPPGKQIKDHEHQMLGSLGNLLANAIEHGCLLRTIREHREELRGLTARLFHSQEEERRRIARELHDEAGQALTGINFALENVLKDLPPDLGQIRDDVMEVKRQVNRTYQEMRRISHRLHPALLSELGLEPALEAWFRRISKHSRIEIDFKMVGFEDRLDPEIETALYRISQEAINNTLKHSGAKRFKLSIIKSYPNLIFMAEDDGMGFDPGQLERNGRALGLSCIRERAAMVGGRFNLRAAEGKGTRIRIEIPVKESPSDGESSHDSAGG